MAPLLNIGLCVGKNVPSSNCKVMDSGGLGLHCEQRGQAKSVHYETSVSADFALLIAKGKNLKGALDCALDGL